MLRIYTLFFIFTNVLSAKVNAQVRDEKESVRSNLETVKIKKKSAVLQQKERELLANIYRINQKQRNLVTEKTELLKSKSGLDADVEVIQKNIIQVEENIRVLKKHLVVRLKNLQKVNTPTLFQSIFGAQDIMEMDRAARIMYKISKSDVEQLRIYQGLKNLLSQQKQELTQKLMAIEDTQKKLEQQQASYKSSYEEKMKLVGRLDQEDQKLLERIKKIRYKNLKKGSSFFDDFSLDIKNAFYEKKGQLAFPIAGIIQQKFGLLKLHHEKIKIYNKGWFVSASEQREVRPVFSGKVVHVGPMEGYQNIVILDHGDHYYSVYGNLDVTYVQIAQDVEAETSLGLTGKSHFYGNGLYVEIRHFSQPEDPMEWFKTQDLRLSQLKEQDI